MKEERKRWTQEEDELLVQTISASPYNLSKCFMSVAKETGRTSASVKFRWYNKVKFTLDGRKAMLTISKDSAYAGKNYTARSKAAPIKKTRISLLYERLLKILGLR